MNSLSELNRRLEDIAAHVVPGEPFQILVLDDDEGILELVRFAFTKKNSPYIVRKAVDGCEAHEHLKRHRIDFALIDERLPGGNSGCDLVKQWKAEGIFCCPWVLISGTTGDDARDELERRALFAGAERVLWKGPGYNWLQLKPYVDALMLCSVRALMVVMLMLLAACQCPTVKRINPVEVRYQQERHILTYPREPHLVGTGARIVTIPARWSYQEVTP